jgi:hypothetical protein
MAVQTVTYRCPHCNQPVDVDLTSESELQVCPHANCGKPFKVEVPTAEAAPEAAAAAAKPAPGAAAPAALPPEVARTEAPEARPHPPASVPAADAENEVAVVHLAMFRRYPLRCLGYALVVLLGAVAVVWGLVTDSWFLWVVGLVFGGLAAFRLLAWALRMNHTVLRVTSRRCVVETGVFKKQAAEIALTNVAEVNVLQRWPLNWLNVGDLLLKSKTPEVKHVLVMAVPDPNGVAAQIRTQLGWPGGAVVS